MTRVANGESVAADELILVSGCTAFYPDPVSPCRSTLCLSSTQHFQRSHESSADESVNDQVCFCAKCGSLDDV